MYIYLYAHDRPRLPTIAHYIFIWRIAKYMRVVAHDRPSNIYRGWLKINIFIKLDFFVAESFYGMGENKKETWVEWRMRVVD